MTHESRVQSAGQDGFTDSKEDLAEEIREYVRKYYSSAQMKTLERLSKLDLTVLKLVLVEAFGAKP
jgi:hypothetical protein